MKKQQDYSKSYLFGLSLVVLTLDTVASYCKTLGDIIMQTSGFMNDSQSQAIAEAVASGELPATCGGSKKGKKKGPVGFHVG